MLDAATADPTTAPIIPPITTPNPPDTAAPTAAPDAAVVTTVESLASLRETFAEFSVLMVRRSAAAFALLFIIHPEVTTRDTAIIP